MKRKTDHAQRHAAAEAMYRMSLERVRTTLEPKGQKFPRGARVRIAKDLGRSMSHFPSGKDATVQYTYAHAYGLSSVPSESKRRLGQYSLNVDGVGSVAWYDEDQLTLIK
jgi:hypothetical protein